MRDRGQTRTDAAARSRFRSSIMAGRKARCQLRGQFEALGAASSRLRRRGKGRARSIIVLIVDSSEGARLNRQLSRQGLRDERAQFSRYEPLRGAKQPLLGDLVICAPVVVARSRGAGEAAARSLRAPDRPRRRCTCSASDHEDDQRSRAGWSSSNARFSPDCGIRDPYRLSADFRIN